MLIELIQTAIMIFGASVGADLTARWYLTMNPRYAGLHQDEAANGLEGQKALDAATVSPLFATELTSGHLSQPWCRRR